MRARDEDRDRAGFRERGGAVILAQEEERRRIAREIHDGPAQALAGLSMRMETCEKLLTCDPQRAAAELAEARRVLASCLDDLRRVIAHLRPMALDDLGLVPALRKLVERFESDTGLRCSLTVMGKEFRVPQAVETALFRTAQEALSNVRKHARASAVGVRVVFFPGSVSLVVRDDGCGFDLARVLGGREAGAPERFGLSGMEERARLLGGRFEIDSAPGAGTRLTLSLPVTADREGDGAPPPCAGPGAA